MMVIVSSAWAQMGAASCDYEEGVLSPEYTSFPVILCWQQKPCQAIISFIDTLASLSFGADVASWGPSFKEQF